MFSCYHALTKTTHALQSSNKNYWSYHYIFYYSLKNHNFSCSSKKYYSEWSNKRTRRSKPSNEKFATSTGRSQRGETVQNLFDRGVKHGFYTLWACLHLPRLFFGVKQQVPLVQEIFHNISTCVSLKFKSFTLFYRLHLLATSYALQINFSWTVNVFVFIFW